MRQRSRPTEQPPSSLLHPPEAQRLLAAAAADAAAPRAEFLFAPPAALHKPLAALLEDSRDLPILFLYLNVALTTAPAALALFCAFPPATRPMPHWLGAAYLIVNYALYLARFMLSLHYSQHRRLFRKGELRAGVVAGMPVLQAVQHSMQHQLALASVPRLGLHMPASQLMRWLSAARRAVATQPGGACAAGSPVWHPIW